MSLRVRGNGVIAIIELSICIFLFARTSHRHHCQLSHCTTEVSLFKPVLLLLQNELLFLWYLDCIETQMENISASTSSNSSLPSPSSRLRVDGIALCSVYLFEAVLIVGGNLLTIVFFAMKRNLRKKSLHLVINMAFADTMVGAVSVPMYTYLVVGPFFYLWPSRASLKPFYFIWDTIFSQASLMSAVFISCERFFAVFWPLKHKTLSMRAHRIAIFMVWTLAIIVSSMTVTPIYLLSRKHAFYLWVSFPLTCLAIVCCCNIGIWRKFQQLHIALQPGQIRSTKNKRLTKTLLFVSVIAVTSWLPLVINNYVGLVEKLTLRRGYLINFIVVILNFSNSFLNPVVYALRIPEFRQSLFLCCSRRQAVTKGEGFELEPKGRVNMAAVLSPVMQLRTVPTYPSHPQQALDQTSVNT